MDKKTKKWGLVLLILCGMVCCFKMMECCVDKCISQKKPKGQKRKSIIKMKNCNGCWVISFK